MLYFALFEGLKGLKKVDIFIYLVKVYTFKLKIHFVFRQIVINLCICVWQSFHVLCFNASIISDILFVLDFMIFNIRNLKHFFCSQKVKIEWIWIIRRHSVVWRGKWNTYVERKTFCLILFLRNVFWDIHNNVL